MEKPYDQNFAHHARIVPAFHFGVFGVFLINLVFRVYRAIRDTSGETLMASSSSPPQPAPRPTSLPPAPA